MEDSRRRLLWHGFMLFLLGLVAGLAEQNFTNPRMGLAAHLQGVMNGTFLIAVGAVWMDVRLSPPWKSTAYWAALYGAYANWAVTVLAAILGTAALNPITAAGHHALPWQEGVVTVGFLSVGVAMLAASALCLFGVRRIRLA